MAISQKPSDEDPISVWIERLHGADPDAAELLWRHFSSRLIALARGKLRPDTRPVYDEEDAAQSAFRSVCMGIVQQRFPDLRDRTSLWRLLLLVTSRKVRQRHRFDAQARRDTRRTQIGSAKAERAGARGSTACIEQIRSREPTPEFAAEFVDTCQTLFDQLQDPALREVALLRVEGYADHEIADRLNCSRRTVQRRLEVVRRRWSPMLMVEDGDEEPA